MVNRIIFYDIVLDFEKYMILRGYSKKNIQGCKYLANRILAVYDGNMSNIPNNCDEIMYKIKGNKNKYPTIRTQVYRFLEFIENQNSFKL